MASIRPATHSGSWYTSTPTKLASELTHWLDLIHSTPEQPLELPEGGCCAVIAPHAGYSYSGETAAWAWRSVDPSSFNRVFILGPSHHVHLTTCALTAFTSYATPLGELPVDRQVVDALRGTGEFVEMSRETDEAEHSIELHLPYIRKIFENREITIVPILVGSLTTLRETHFGNLLASHLKDPKNLFVISSDFCHWGTRFRYTPYQPSATHPSISISRSTKDRINPSYPIYRFIRELDERGMNAIAFSGEKGAREAQEVFGEYLRETGNTICGRHPIGVLLAALAHLEEEEEGEGRREVRWIRYAQSGEVRGWEESSVSYAAGIVVRKS